MDFKIGIFFIIYFILVNFNYNIIVVFNYIGILNVILFFLVFVIMVIDIYSNNFIF